MIFDELKRRSQCLAEYSVSVSCFELHIETVRDLLDLQNEQAQLMTNQSKWHPTTLQVRTLAEVESVLRRAYDNRSIASTNLNETSSRSHCIYQLLIRTRAEDGWTTGSLNLVDLAGSENINASGVVGERKEEATAINKHLTALKDVISAMLKNQAHIPFRNSKLTNLLQHHLGPDAKVLMIVNVSPVAEHINDSINSLNFAKDVNECRLTKKRRA